MVITETIATISREANMNRRSLWPTIYRNATTPPLVIAMGNKPQHTSRVNRRARDPRRVGGWFCCWFIISFKSRSLPGNLGSGKGEGEISVLL